MVNEGESRYLTLAPGARTPGLAIEELEPPFVRGAGLTSTAEALVADLRFIANPPRVNHVYGVRDKCADSIGTPSPVCTSFALVVPVCPVPTYHRLLSRV